ncbi:Sensory/regulatory protein RpfC [Seminavis robusta]|uniref:histidine kinase n=1 Tax=Seminavis robusta TaxID=568900 RepID=A0A9N8E1S0_9STRA|nr:Sensory/regulatory protein RpfC [Seminavis robusta]|eukprot:Sro564_g167480.1 Sensory/regulatory protein RpfC (842) ;mRNA; r:50282-53085
MNEVRMECATPPRDTNMSSSRCCSKSIILLAMITLTSLPLAAAATPEAPHLNGTHFRITALEEHGFLDIAPDGKSFSGYLIDMIDALSKPDRANFTFDLLPPSGYGSLCNPRLTPLDAGAYNASFRTQYNCGATDVNDGPNTTYATDMYLGMYYVTPSRQLINQFTIPFLPPYSGTLAMFGTATGIPNFEALVEQQQSGILSPDVTCGPAGSALIESVVQSFPGLQIRGIYGGEEEIYQAFVDRSCQVYITDGPIAAQFVLRRSRRDQCTDSTGAPIGVIGDPMQFGLSHYAIGIRQDIDPNVAHTLSYWMNILMTCNPLDPTGPCPDGNFATFYKGRGGTGEECGYVLYPEQGLTTGALAGIVIAVVVFVVAIYTLWHRYRLARQRHRYAKKSQAAMAQAQREREFNEYMAHEIRGPLSCAIPAISFVASKSSDPNIVPDPEHRALIKADINVIDSSLQFVNELLRNMLDLHRTQTGHTIKLHMLPTDIQNDIFEPISTILFMRGAAVKIETVCHPPGLTIMADRMRLKQLCLNLAANASKFVQQGYIRLRAEVVPLEEASPTQSSSEADETGDIEDQQLSGSHKTQSMAGAVILYVEDSGPGIPEEKRKSLFAKFQDSRDVLNQGTGIGLSVCKNLSELMGGTLDLDDDFDSGIPGCLGTRFRLRLNQMPLDMDNVGGSQHARDFFNNEKEYNSLSGSLREDLPEDLKVLFVDDDLMLRKMFSRVLTLAAPTWNFKEASNGETALKIVEEEEFDIIFVDQYMASVEKQLLGTETVRALRAKGVDSIICGLSANDLDEQFSEAGANAFMVKPFPCKKELLKDELRQMLQSREQWHQDLPR